MTPVPVPECILELILFYAFFYLQLLSVLSPLPRMDLRGLPKLTDLAIGDNGGKLSIMFPPQLHRLESRSLLSAGSWRQLSACKYLQQLDIDLMESPAISPETLSSLQNLVMSIHDLAAVEWGIALAKRCPGARLTLHEGAALLQGSDLQLESLTLTCDCTCEDWQGLTVHTLYAANFQGTMLVQEQLPLNLVACRIWAKAASSMIVDLSLCSSLQGFQLLVDPTCRLELAGRFQVSQKLPWVCIRQSGKKRCRPAAFA